MFQNEGILINEQWSLKLQFDNRITHENLLIEGSQNNEIITETNTFEDDNTQECVGNCGTLLHPAESLIGY